MLFVYDTYFGDLTHSVQIPLALITNDCSRQD